MILRRSVPECADYLAGRWLSERGAHAAIVHELVEVIEGKLRAIFVHNVSHESTLKVLREQIPETQWSIC